MRTSTWRPSLVVVMPCFNEEGIAGFVDEVRRHLAPHAGRLQFVVVDDCSTQVDTEALLGSPAEADVTVRRHRCNLGHGPTVMSAYAYALDCATDLVIHVDGDGQFFGSDMLEVLHRLRTSDVVVGERTRRREPWYRTWITQGLSAVFRGRTGCVRDVNSPLRGYRRAALAQLYATVPSASMVPHVLMTLQMAATDLAVTTVDVRSRPRLGSTANGTTWGATVLSPALPSLRLLRFCLQAAQEVLGSRDAPSPAPTGDAAPAPAA